MPLAGPEYPNWLRARRFQSCLKHRLYSSTLFELVTYLGWTKIQKRPIDNLLWPQSSHAHSPMYLPLENSFIGLNRALDFHMGHIPQGQDLWSAQDCNINVNLPEYYFRWKMHLHEYKIELERVLISFIWFPTNVIRAGTSKLEVLL